jgi:hypothetical protein
MGTQEDGSLPWLLRLVVISAMRVRQEMGSGW